MSIDPDTAAMLDRMRGISTATLTTQLFKRGLRRTYVQGVAPVGALSRPMVGIATTLRYIPAREDLDHVGVFADPAHPQRRVIETIPPGHVLVQDCRGDTSAACGGGILMTRLAVRGAAGMVSDGCVRDWAQIAAMDLPVFCAGRSAPLNLVAHHAVEIDVPIGCGGVAVYPGDIVVGDADGVVIVPRHLAADIAADGLEQERLEMFVQDRIAAGAALPGTYPPDEATRAAYVQWCRERR